VVPQGRCPRCAKRRLIGDPELRSLAIAHIDCDAFYASVEKRDRPELRDKPVIVGGGRRGVVSAACYVARLSGVRSAMPMFKALERCPDATVIRPDMAKYVEIGRDIRAMMLDLTPMVEPLSIDEAFLDLSGTEALHGGPPARTLARFALAVEEKHRLTVSVGLSYNKSLAKIASDLDKPRGFAILSRAKAPEFLAAQPVGLIWGVGKALRGNLEKDGIRLIGDLLPFDEASLVARYGSMGKRLYFFARGEDARQVEPHGKARSISNETTFDKDVADLEDLKPRLWRLCEQVARRLRKAELSGGALFLKLKTSDFRLLTRHRRLQDPTQLAAVLYKEALPLLEKEADGRRFRLIGIGCDHLGPGEEADPPSLLEPEKGKAAAVERAMESLRAKLGNDAVMLGRGFPAKGKRGD